MQFTLALDVSYVSGYLRLDFTIGTAKLATWITYAIVPYPTVQIIPLWGVPLQIIHPPTEYPIIIPWTSMGWVGIWTALYTGEGPQAVEFDWVDTGW